MVCFLHVQNLTASQVNSFETFDHDLFLHHPADLLDKIYFTFSGSCSEQSDNFPGNPPPLITVLRCTIPRAFFWLRDVCCKNNFELSGHRWVFFNVVHISITA
jgi:hypothetical protein